MPDPLALAPSAVCAERVGVPGTLPVGAMVLPDELDSLWPKIEHLIERGLKRGNGGYSAADIRRAIARRKKQLWLGVPDAGWALVTQLDLYPAGKVCHIFLLAGRMPRGWQTILFHVEQWAKSEGCKAIELRGRIGWRRRLPDYFQPAIYMRKELA